MPEFRDLDTSDDGIRETLELLEVVFPTAKHMNLEYMQKLYRGNPVGETFGYCAYESGELVGHYLMIPIKARVFGEEEVGIWPFQLATHPERRLKGIFSTFVQASIDMCKERGYGFITGIGNANSSPIFIKKFGFQGTCQLDVRVGLGMPPAPDPSRLPDCQFERVWDEKAGITWRMGHSPEAYQIKVKGDTAHIFADTGKLGLKVQIGAVPRALLEGEHAKLSGWNPLRMWIGKDASRNWAASTWIPMPKRWRPVPLTMLWLDCTGKGREFEAEKVRFEVFDFDAY